ncbi:MAG: hypothetical protein A2V67_09705 [Deltaproteobacteria bacterium RBG_13_61_14]|nr:MAG: hypothetical protein A2V67_09705 [Deltaproteobacteria bacterium RBG_13_61_14]
MPSTLAVNLHDLCRAVISGPEWLLAPAAQEFAHHLADPERLGQLDLGAELSLGFQGPPSGTYRAAAWQVELSRLDQAPLRLRFRGNRLSRFIVTKRIVEPALRYWLTRQGFPPVHSTCLSDGETGVVVAAGATTGKTTLLLQWLSQGHPFLSDDYTILAPGKALAYVTPLRLGARNLIETPKLRGLPFSDQFAILARTAVRQLLFNKVRFAYKCPVSRIFPGIRFLDEVPLATVIIVTPGAVKDLQEIPAEEAADLIAAIDHHEMHGFDRVLAKAGEKHYHDLYRQKLLAILGQVPCLELGWSPGSRLELDQLMGKGR